MSLRYDAISCPQCQKPIIEMRCSVTDSTLTSCNFCGYYSFFDPEKEEQKTSPLRGVQVTKSKEVIR